MAGILDKCVFVIDQYIPLRKKVELIRMIKASGGASVYSVSEKSTHLITSQEGFNEPSAKVAAATLAGLFVVSKEFVVDSIAQGSKVEESNYFFTPGAAPTSPTTPTSPPQLTVTIPPRPANSPQQPGPLSASSSASSPRSPPGFNNNNMQRAPSLQDKKGGFGRLRVDVNTKGASSPQSSPLSPKSPYSNSSSGIAGSEEEDDDDEDDDDSSDEDGPKPSFKDVVESNKRAWESATPQYGAEDDGCKIFVGGIMFDDLEALKKTKDGYSASEEVIAHIQKLKNERLIEIIRIFSRFGTVVRVKQFLEKRHIFITYDNKQSALAALRTLKPLEVRKKIVQEVRERLRGEDRQTLVSPRSNFYVRWPHHVESEREDGGYSSASHSYFSGSSAPSSPTGISQPQTQSSQKLNWRQQPSSPTGNYQPYQRSYFTNNFTNASRSTSMRSYSRNSESDYENSNNPNSFSENESSQYSRQQRTQLYQHPHRTPDITPPKPAILSESDSDSPAGIRHRVVDRSIDRSPPADTTASTSSSSTAANSSSTVQPASAQPVATAALLNPAPSARAASPSYTQQKRRAVNEEGNWHKVLVLLLVLASMAIVYLYNK